MYVVREVRMAQLHCYLPDQEVESLKRRAELAGMSVSRCLAELARQDLRRTWPEGYFEWVVGGADIAPIERPDQGAFEQRPSLGE
ncbi:MAG: hypothetical protein ACOCZF_02860 [Halorhodospira sp.]